MYAKFLFEHHLFQRKNTPDTELLIPFAVWLTWTKDTFNLKDKSLISLTMEISLQGGCFSPLAHFIAFTESPSISNEPCP